MKIRYAPLAVACALMVAAAATTTAQAAAVTYTFGGTVDSSGVSSVAVGNTFTGSFTFESTSSDLGGGFYDPNITITGTVNGQTFTSTSPCGVCGGIQVVDVTSGFRDAFVVSSFRDVGALAPLTGPVADGFPPYLLRFIVADSSGTVFSNTALPSSLTLSSFDASQFQLGFIAPNGAVVNVLGPITSLTLAPAAPVPEASTSAMWALGLGALAFVRRRKGH